MATCTYSIIIAPAETMKTELGSCMDFLPDEGWALAWNCGDESMEWDATPHASKAECEEELEAMRLAGAEITELKYW